MIKYIILQIIQRRRATLLVLSLLFILGLYLLQHIPISFYPKTSKPTFIIDISGTGMAAEDMYADFNSKIQSALSSVGSLESSEVQFYSSSGLIRIWLYFPWRTSIEKAQAESQNFLSNIDNLFPSTFNDPVLYYSDDGSSGYLAVALYSATLTNSEIYEQALSLLNDEIGAIKGVEYFNISPIRQLRSEIIFDPDTLLNFSLTPDSIISRVSSEYRTTSLGSFRDGRRRFNLRSIGSIEDIFSLGELPVATVGGQSLLLADVATVNVFYDLPNNIYRVNGEPAIMIAVYPEQGASVKVMAEEVLAAIDRRLPEFSDIVETDVLVNPAEFIDNAINNVLNSALLGAVLAMIVTLTFLGIFRNTLIVISAIPISIIYAFIFLYNFDVSINLISLSGLAISVGMSLDAAIVVMENIHRHRLENMTRPSPLAASVVIANATSEVAQPVFMSALTSIAVFFPLRFTSPLASAILGDLALAIIFTLAASIFVSFTVIPLLAYYLFRSNKPLPSHQVKTTVLLRFSQALMGFLSKIYERALRFFIQKPLHGIGLLVFTLILGASSFFLMQKLPFAIIEDPDSASITVDIRNQETQTINDFMLELEPIEKHIMELIGESTEARFLSTRSSNAAQLHLIMKNAKTAKAAITLLEKELIPDTTWSFTIVPYNPAKMPIPSTFALLVSVSGNNEKEIFNYMDLIADQALQIRRSNNDRAYTFVGTMPTTVPTNQLIFKAKDEVFIELSEYAKNRLNSILNTTINGSRPITFVLNNGQEIKPQFRFPEITTKEEVGNILIPFNGKAIPVSHFFSIEEQSGINSIVVLDNQKITQVRARAQADIPLAELTSFERELEQRIKENITFKPGYSYRILDAKATIKEAISSLLVAFIISVLLVFLILTLQFNSFKLSLIILVAIPLGVIGALFSLYLFNSNLSINSMLGMILLGGIAINNSLLIVDFYINDSTSTNKYEAIVRACLLRFPPILSTTITTLLGMLPIAMAIGDGSNVIKPLGIAVSGGLALSTFFTLFVIPVILTLTMPEKTIDKSNTLAVD